jgi:hypothetical protein
MLLICETYALEHRITFNSKKTICIKFGSSVGNDEKAFINGSPIKWFDHVKHLGNYVCNDLNDELDCTMKCATFIGSVNKLIGNYGNMQHSIMSKLFNTYCCSFYGSQLWNLDCKGISKCAISWNKAVRRILHLPPRTHGWMLGPLTNQSHISVQYAMRMLHFLKDICNSSNNVIHYVSCISILNANSLIGRKYSYLVNNYGISIDDDIVSNIKRIKMINILDENRNLRVDTIKELLNCRDGIDTLEHFDLLEVNRMLYNLTTDL